MTPSICSGHPVIRFSAGLIFSFISLVAFAQQTWFEVPTPDPSDRWNMLRDISGTSSNDVWTVGSYETTPANMKNLILHWDGSAWQSYDGTDQSTSWNDLWGVTAITSSNVWAAGFHNTFANTNAQLLHWNGSNWSHTSLPLIPGGSYLDAIDAIRADDIWAVGGKAGSPVRPCYALHYDGSDWTDVPVPNVGTFRNAFYDVDAIATDDVWAVGHYGHHYGDFHPMAQHWNGSSWSNVSLPEEVESTLGELYSVTMISSDDVWALGSSLMGDLIMIHWNGTQWSMVPTEGSSGGTVAARNTDVFSFGYRVSQWEDDHWTVIDSINQVYYPTLVSAVTFSNGDVWAAGVSGADSLHTFVYRSDPAPLAVTISDYQVSRYGSSVMMEWSTLTETNADHFVMERSNDALHFTAINEMPAHGSAHHYQLIDETPLPGNNYYRLKLVDLDGTITLFPVRKLNFDENGNNSFEVYPNPVRGSVVNLEWQGQGEHQLVLYNQTGQQVKSWIINRDSGSQLNLPTGLTPGVYVFSMVMGDEVFVKRIVIP